jgi:serine/threonine-protein kinase
LTVRGGRKDFVKILDFGLAALTRDARLAPKGAVFGTPEYMAPEQARGEDATALCDLYALGILFFEMLTGQLPFRSNDRETLLELQRSAKPPVPSSLRKDMPKQAEAIILRLLEKDPAKRFRDGHHLQEELKAFQRSLPARPLEVNQTDAPVAAPPPPPAPTPGVQEWGTRAANFQRVVSRAYPSEQIPDDVREASEKLWELASKASRLEGELAAHSRKLEATERRGRGLRAEIGRKVEELAAEESRALREATDWQERAEALQSRRDETERQLAVAEANANRADAKQHDLAALRDLFEAVGSARASRLELQRQTDRYVERAGDKKKQAEGLRAQVDDLRKQLQRYSDALENDLASGRERIARRVKEALEYETAFNEASSLLLRHLSDKPECRDLLKELADESQRGLHERRRRQRRSYPQATDG